MSTQLAERTVPTVVCDGCGQTLLAIFTTEQRAIRLDSEPVPGGVYVLDEHNRARRRTLTELYRAARAHRETLGYDAHDCHPQPWYAR